MGDLKLTGEIFIKTPMTNDPEADLEVRQTAV